MPNRSRRLGQSRCALLLGLALCSLGCERIEGIRIGVNYTAKGLCSCLFVMERDLDRCYGDMIGAVARIPVEIDTEAQSVRTSLFVFFVGEASHEVGRGCSLE